MPASSASPSWGRCTGARSCTVGPDGPRHDVHGHLHGIGDGLVTAEPEVTLGVRAADCVPVLFADAAGRRDRRLSLRPARGRRRDRAGHAWRRCATLGASTITAWVGPHVCGRCYEVPQELQDAVAAVEPATRATTSWGTPSLDVGAGVRAQLEREGVQIVDLSRCTIESPDLFSYRREGKLSGRQAGLIRIAG